MAAPTKSAFSAIQRVFQYLQGSKDYCLRARWQEWVKMLRNKSLVKPLHVPSEDNLADIFTKILDKPTFINLRDRLLHQKKQAAA